MTVIVVLWAMALYSMIWGQKSYGKTGADFNHENGGRTLLRKSVSPTRPYDTVIQTMMTAEHFRCKIPRLENAFLQSFIRKRQPGTWYGNNKDDLRYSSKTPTAMTIDWVNGNIFWKNHVRILAGDKLRSEIVRGLLRPFQGNQGMYIQRQAMELATLNLWVLLPERSTQCSLQPPTFCAKSW
jgi:hypothetical protein